MIEIKNLSKTFHLKGQDVQALNDVSLSIAEGEVYGVIGYSGAGKSTLVRCLNLLEVPDSGEIEIDGTTMFSTLKGGRFELKGKELNQARRGIGMIFQHFNLLDRSTVFDNIAYPLKYTGMSKEDISKRVLELLELVDLSDKAYVYPSQLSGGQKQRVAIARAIANNPKVLLSDEATSALDPDATESILALLKDLNAKLGITIVIITHEMSIIKTITDKVAVMENGCVVEEGDTYSVFSKPRAPITKKFVATTSNLGKLDSLIANDPSLQEAAAGGKLVKLTFDKDSVGDAVISQLSRQFNVNTNIVLANIDILRAGTLGSLVCAFSGSDEDIARSMTYLSENHVGLEVIR